MKKYVSILVLAGCAAAFAFGIVYLFQLRFEAGDVYPPYSSLRADPLGAMALYESLGKIPGLTVRRDFSESNRLRDEPQTVYLHLAGNPYEWDWLQPEDYQDIQDFLARDGRLVITFFPRAAPDVFGMEEEGTNATENKKMTPPKKGGTDEDDEDSGGSLEDEWNFKTAFKRLEQDGDNYAPVAVANKTDLALPQTLDWHSGIIFTNLGKSWHVIYARGKNAVVIERKFNRGSVVIATDSYFVSNEALAKDRHAELLAWMIGSRTNIVFDEAHFGIVETSGVATLMRKYRLHGVAAGLLLLAGLFIWKNSLSLVPPQAEEERENFVRGKDSAAGFVNLLRRGIAPRLLLGTCFAEWKKTAAPKGQASTPRIQKAEAIFSVEDSLPNKDRNPVEAYKKISETLKKL